MVQELTKSNFDTEVLGGKGPALVDFFADWCGPCKMLGPVISELSEQYSGMKFYKVNIDKEPDLAAQFNVMSIPTVILFDGGQVKETSVGFLPKQAMAEKIEGVLNGR